MQCNGTGPSSLKESEIWSRMLFPVFEQSKWDYLKCLVEKSSDFEFGPETKLDILSKALMFDHENLKGWYRWDMKITR